MIRPLRAIALEARLDATPAQVWHALTDARALADWFAPYVKAEQRERGTVEMAWDPLSTYGVDSATVGEIQRSLDDAVTRLLEPAVAATL